ncbi:MAG: RDD family protein [Acidobacteriota bacterium]
MDKRVGFGPRLAAAVIDVVVITILGLVFGGMLGAALGLGAGAAAGLADAGEAAAAAAAAAGALGGMAIGISLIGFLYSLIEGLTGASPGKMILKLKVGTADGRNAPISTYLTRWAVKYSNALLGTLGVITGVPIINWLGTVAGLVVFVGCFLVLGASKQAIHDMVAKTAVYNRADLG